MAKEPTLSERIYDFVMDNPYASNVEISDCLRSDYDTTKTMLGRLVRDGLIRRETRDGKRYLTIEKDFIPKFKRKPKTYKQQVYQDMIDVYIEDFKLCETFRERLEVGREIRLLMKEI